MSTALSLDGTTSSLSIDMGTAVLSYAAVIWGLKRNLETVQAIARVVPPLAQEASKPDELVVSPLKPSRLWRYLPNKAQWRLIAQQIVILSAGILLPRYGSRRAMDVFGILFQMWILTFIYNRAVGSIYPRPQLLRYQDPESATVKTYNLETTYPDTDLWHRDSTRTGLAAMLAAATLGALASGQRWVIVFIPPAWVLAAVDVYIVPWMRIKWLALGLIAYHVFTVIVVMVGLTVTAYFFTSTSSTLKPKEPTLKLARASPWLTEAMMVMRWLFIFVIPASIVDMTNRFEQSVPPATPPGSNNRIRDEDEDGDAHSYPHAYRPGEPVPVVRTSRLPMPGPLVGVGLFCMASALAAILYLEYRYGDGQNKDFILFGSVGTLGLPLCGIAGSAYYQGRFSHWCEYHERWATRSKEVTEAADNACSPHKEEEKSDVARAV